MSLVDFILNLAGILLWLNWRSLRFDPLVKTSAASLAGTLKRAEPRRLKGWQLLGGLGALLGVRAVLYWQIGAAADWTPKLDLMIVVLAFRSDILGSALLFSGLSFGRMLLILYFWLLALALINRSPAEADPLQKAIRLHLGRIGRWPWYIQLLLPGCLIAGLWIALHPLLVYLNVIGKAQSRDHLMAQGLLVGGGIYFSAKYLLPAILFLHLVISHVYLGRNPLWTFVSNTARNLLVPLQGLPLQLARVDFAPLVGAILILILLHVLPIYWMPWLEGQLHVRLWPVWPQ